MYKPSTLPNTRIDVADILRGIAIGGIVLIHFIEQLNFYNFPEPSSPFWAALNQGIWDTVFFLLAGKMYAIFAMLFGLSFFIQHDNQAQKGNDFRLRFFWRMILLFIFGLFDLLFYNGDILCVYAACGVLIIPLIRASDKVLKWIAVLMLIQPIELIYAILGAIDPSTAPLNLGSYAHFGALSVAQAGGSIIDVAVAGITHGLPINFFWAIENGRLTQTIFFFLVGIMIGRKRLFYNEGDNLKFWKKVLIGSFIAMAILIPLYYIVPGMFETRCVSKSLNVMLNMWKNLAMMLAIVSGTTLLFYKTSAKNWLIKIAPYGKMSLTNYVTQSIIGSFLYFGYGLGLHAKCGTTVSICIGIVFLILQVSFAHWWMARHKRGPLESIWHKLTWIK